MELRHRSVVFSVCRLLSVFYFFLPFLRFIFCYQGRKVHSHWPLPSLGPAGGELPCQAPLTAEEPVQAAHGSQSASSPDWHSVRDRNRRRWEISMLRYITTAMIVFPILPVGVISCDGYQLCLGHILKLTFLQLRVKSNSFIWHSEFMIW